jgi:Restriction endonuclease
VAPSGFDQTPAYHRGVPKRTNLFQEVVEILHRHMAGDATVVASEMLPSRSTGALCEVDVVIRAKQAGHEVVVSVEAMARSRKADRTWVDQMVGKHADLETSKLVLVSQRGFTKEARATALARNAVPLAPEDLPSTDREGAVIKAVPALWPKFVAFTVEELSVTFTDDDAPTAGWGEAAPTVFVDEGTVGSLIEVVEFLYKSRFAELVEQIDLANRTTDSVERFTLVVEPDEGEEIQLRVNDVRKTLFLLNENGVGYSLRRITAAGKGDIKVSSKIPLTHGRLGDWNVNFGYGEGKVAGRDALVVASERDDGEGQITMRIRPAPSTQTNRLCPTRTSRARGQPAG